MGKIRYNLSGEFRKIMANSGYLLGVILNLVEPFCQKQVKELENRFGLRNLR